MNTKLNGDPKPRQPRSRGCCGVGLAFNRCGVGGNMGEHPVWEREGRDWPNREASRFVKAAGLRWHVQQAGSGPVLFLVHGTGAATHSWRDLLPLLARDFTVIAPDLPGHGFTDMPAPAQLSLPGMARLLSELLHTLGVRPEVVVGHSAGSAILARMCLDGSIAPHLLVSLNGAMLPLRGLPGHIFSPIARLVVSLPVTRRMFAWQAADRRVVARMLRGTGSSIDPAGVEQYVRLARCPSHAGAALTMMANWDLRPLERDLPRLRTHLLLITGSNDHTIPPSDSARVHALVPGSELVSLPGLGHLAHEEQPARIAALIHGAASTQAAA
jgi:magnesium chelatase accessory protein